MSLDRQESLVYPGSESGNPAPDRSEVTAVIVFLSFPSRDDEYAQVVKVLRHRGFTVFTNFDRTNLDGEGAETKTDLRLARIRRSDVFVFFAGSGFAVESSIRQAEFGYALGLGLHVAYVGRPINSLHRYGDTFDDVDDFIAGWYSDEYLDGVSQWFTDGKGQAPAA